MSQPLPINPFDTSIQSIQNFIRFHQASAQLGLSLLARNQTSNPFLPKRSNLILSGDSKDIPMIPPVFQNAMKPTFPQNLFEQKLNQPQLPFLLPNHFDKMRSNLESSFKTEVKVEDSHHSDVTKDSESVKKEEEELMIEGKSPSPKILAESKKIAKIPKAKKSPPKQQVKEDNDENLSEGKESSDENKAEPKWRRKCWSNSEDSQLLELIEIHGKKWSKIASAMGGRTGKQVRDRYLNVLIPDIKRTNWTDLEDRLIWALYFQLGTKWCKIAEHLPGRTEGQVKNRFYTYLKKKSDKEEEEMRANLVIKPDMQDLLFQAQAQRIKKEEPAPRGILPKIEQ